MGFCKVFKGMLGVMVVISGGLTTDIWFWEVRGLAEIILEAELDITGPGSDALGVKPDTMLVAAGAALGAGSPFESLKSLSYLPAESLLGTLSAIAVPEIERTGLSRHQDVLSRFLRNTQSFI